MAKQYVPTDGMITAKDVPNDIADAIIRVNTIFHDALLSGKHRPGDWRLLGWEGNFEAFSEHIAKFVRDGEFNVENEDHLAHATCRLLLLLQLWEEALAARRSRRPTQT